MKISIIMPIWNTNQELVDLTKAALKSIKKARGETEIIVVDNGSTMGDFFNDSFLVIKNKKNLGYPKAVNQGLAYASGDLIVIANNDIKVHPQWAAVTRKAFKTFDDIGTLHFKMVPYEAPYNTDAMIWKTGKERWCHGSFFVFRKEAIPDGGYDEKYGLGGYDDYDMFHRLRENGWFTAYTNESAFKHKDSSTQNLLDPQERSVSDKKNRQYFKRRHGEYPDVLFEQTFPEQMQVNWLPFP